MLQKKIQKKKRYFNANEEIEILGTPLKFDKNYSVYSEGGWTTSNTIKEKEGENKIIEVTIENNDKKKEEEQTYYYFKENGKTYRWVYKKFYNKDNRNDIHNFGYHSLKKEFFNDNEQDFVKEKEFVFKTGDFGDNASKDILSEVFFNKFEINDNDLLEVPKILLDKMLDNARYTMQLTYSIKVKDLKHLCKRYSKYHFFKKTLDKIKNLPSDNIVKVEKTFVNISEPISLIFKFSIHNNSIEITYKQDHKDTDVYPDRKEFSIQYSTIGRGENYDNDYFDNRRNDFDELKKMAKNSKANGSVRYTYLEDQLPILDINKYYEYLDKDKFFYEDIKNQKKYTEHKIKQMECNKLHILSKTISSFRMYGLISGSKFIFEGPITRTFYIQNHSNFKVFIADGCHYFEGIIGYDNSLESQGIMKPVEVAHPEGYGVFTMGSDDEIEIFGKKILFRKGEKIECDHWTNFKEINPKKILVSGAQVDAIHHGIEIKITGTDGKERIITVKEDAITHNIGFTENNNGTQVVINEEQVSPSINKENEEKKIDNELQQFIKDNNLNQDINNNEPTVSSNIDLSKPRTHYKNNTNNTNNTNTNEQPKLSIPDDNKQQGAGEPKFNPLLAMLLLITIIGFILYVINYLSDYKKWKEVNNGSNYNSIDLLGRRFV